MFSGFGRGGMSGRSSGGGSSERRLQEEAVTAVVDTRTNSVIVTAAGETMAQVAQMVEGLDSNPAGDAKVFVYSLENADIDGVAEILNSLFGDQRSSSRSSSARSSGRSSSGYYRPSSSSGGQRPSSGSGRSSSGGGTTQRR